ncbi:LuxR C-terminal-related transcriptional regulator [Streptomyces blattellae]|uniref:LuxR C-terminal-related transcriptional regulator n=1 Tax=Streptomyces blattellae TaxID=2569855 RepID=UPI001E36E988|nr:LuxR C-terminal-related transcriptional regulator [Streptomyces blattellae]
MSDVAGAEKQGAGPTSPCVDPLGDPFLPASFAVPARPATFLRRDRLVSHLDQALRTPLTVVNGAAGAGKTLLAADWAAGLDRPVAWLTTDAVDQGPGMFWAYLIQALQASGTPVPPSVGKPSDTNRVDHMLLARLATHLSGCDPAVVLVLDEYDRVSAPEIADQLEFVLHHAGAGLHLILVSRTEPLLPLHRYRAAGAMTEIRGAELAFTPDEAATLLARHGLRLGATAVSALVARTQGWAAGLRLCALAALDSPDPALYLKEFEADRSTVADFLLAEVLKRQTAETQDLLLRVSVLERICPDLANALTGRGDAEPLLAGLHRENAFIEYDGHAWYRLHPLFGEILRAHLRVRSPGLEPELHRRAARWLRQSGFLSEMLAHGAAAGDWEFTAGALVEDLAIGQLLTGLRSAELAELFSRMGPEAESPATNLVRAARELSRSDLDRGLAHLHQAEEGLAEDAPGAAAARLSCSLLEVLAARLSGSPACAEEAAAAAGDLRREVPAHLLDKHPELIALLQTHLGSARLWAGRFEEARAALTTVAGRSGGAATALPREESLGHLALIDYLNGWPGRAERKALAAMSETDRLSRDPPSGSGIDRVVLAAVAVDRDDLAQAQSLLDAAADSPPALRDPVTETGRAIARARLLLARGHTQAALEAAEPDVPAAVVSPWAEGQTTLVASAVHLAEGRPEVAARILQTAPDDQLVCAVAAAQAQLAAGRPDVAVDLLDGAHPEGRAGPALTVRATLVRARAADMTGDSAGARRLLGHALIEARRERLRRPFLEAGPWLRPHLVTEPLQGLGAGWLTPGPPPPAAQSAAQVVEELSGRESDVLQRLAQMMSTEDIAADLYLSVNTVKTHLKSVYRKLGVNRRNDAVRRARALRLL